MELQKFIDSNSDSSSRSYSQPVNTNQDNDLNQNQKIQKESKTSTVHFIEDSFFNYLVWDTLIIFHDKIAIKFVI